MKIWREDDGGISPDRLAILEQAADLAARGEGLSGEGLELSLSFVSEEEIRQLNREYRNRDRVTDVLSFPMYENPEEIGAARSPEGVLLGDVVICTGMIAKQAVEYGHSEEREMVYLFVHSVLHLLGHDHEEEEERIRMRRAEDRVMDALGIGREQE